MNVLLRDFLAASFRAVPYFKGKSRLSLVMTDWLTRYHVEQDCFVTIKMRDGSLMQLDLRSFEKIAFFSGEYDYGVIQRLASVLKPGSTVLDVGANVGFYTIALGRRLKQLSNHSKLWAFEPVPSNFDRLVGLTALNQLSEVVQPISMALGNQDGEIQLHLADSQTAATTGNAVWLKGAMIDTLVPTCSSQITKLDLFAQKQNIVDCDLIKVDIEGAELEFLKGGANFINQTRPILYSEFNQHWANEFGYEFSDLADLMTSWNYVLYQQFGRRSFRPIKDSPVGLTNILMVPQEKDSEAASKLGVVRR